MVFFYPSAELFRSKHLQPGYFVNNRNELVLTIQFWYFLVENSDIFILFEPECLNSLHTIPKELVLCTSGQKISLKPDEEFDFLTDEYLSNQGYMTDRTLFMVMIISDQFFTRSLFYM